MASMNHMTMMLSIVIVLLVVSSPSNAHDVPSTSKEHPLYKPVDALCHRLEETPDYCAKALKKSDDATALAKVVLDLGENQLPEFEDRLSAVMTGHAGANLQNPGVISALLQLGCGLHQASTGYMAAKLFVSNPKAINKETRDVLARTYPWVTIAARNIRIDLVRSKGDQEIIDRLKAMEELFYLAYVLTSEVERNAG